MKSRSANGKQSRHIVSPKTATNTGNREGRKIKTAKRRTSLAFLNVRNIFFYEVGDMDEHDVCRDADRDANPYQLAEQKMKGDSAQANCGRAKIFHYP